MPATGGLSTPDNIRQSTPPFSRHPSSNGGFTPICPYHLAWRLHLECSANPIGAGRGRVIFTLILFSFSIPPTRLLNGE